MVRHFVQTEIRHGARSFWARAVPAALAAVLPIAFTVRTVVRPPAPQSRCYSFSVLSRRALVITETEDRLIAAAAIIGDSNRPKIGNRMPAAIGTPIVL